MTKNAIKNHNRYLVRIISVFFCLCCLACSTVQASSTDVKVTSISLSGYGTTGGDTVLIGETINMSVYFQPYNATNREVIWSTSNSSVAKVNNGVVTTYKKGTAVITATSVDGNFKASHNVTVVDENATYEYNGTTYDYVWEKGTWGSNIKWYHCVGNKLIITGSGDMKEPGHPVEIPWRNIDPLSVEIQEGITSLCGSALEGLGNATVLKLPSTIKKTGQNTFYVFGKQLNVNGVTYFGGTTYYGGTPDQYNEIDFGYHPFGGLPYKIEYCRASGHIESVSEPVAPTCRSYGKTIGVNCEQCGKEIVKSTQVDYIDCIYEDGYCTMCGIADPTVYVTSVNIPVDSYVLELNESISINATVSPENATNQKIIWSSSNPEIAAISANGLVTGKLLGRVTITATSEDGNKSDTCIVTVVEPTVPVSSISLNKSELGIQIGDTETLVATVLPTNATNKSVTWTTSNENVVSVQNGALTAKETGDAIITVTTTDGGYSDTCYVSVIEPIVNVTGIELSITSEEIYQGVSLPIQAIITPENATNKEIIWKSSDENVVVVDRIGEHTNAHAVAVGTAIITATTVDGNKSAECIIVVKERKPSSGSGDSNDDEVNETAATVVIGNKSSRAFQSISIPVTISENIGLTGLQFKCTYSDVLSLTKIEQGSALQELEFTMPGDLSANPITLLWDGMDADDSTGEILILTFQIAENAELGDYHVDFELKTACNQNLDEVDVKIKDGTVSVVSYTPGDVDEDGDVDTRDVILTRRFVAGGYGASILEAAADVDANGEINSRDIIFMRRYIAGGYGVELK